MELFAFFNPVIQQSHFKVEFTKNTNLCLAFYGKIKSNKNIYGYVQKIVIVICVVLFQFGRNVRRSEIP